jgi:hypothetical protein
VDLAIYRHWYYSPLFMACHTGFVLFALTAHAIQLRIARTPREGLYPEKPARESATYGQHTGDDMLKLFIGIGIPYIGVIGLLPWVASVDMTVLGVPFIYAWIFGWFVLTSGCLMLCWRLFDCHFDDAHPDNN